MSYSCFSWFLYQLTATWIVWLALLIFALLQALLFTTFSEGFKNFISGWLSSDIGYFSVIAIGAFSITWILVWFHVFEYVAMVVGAEILARLDLQSIGCNKWQALALLTSASVLGLLIGGLVSHSVGSWIS
jgi:hypothetical protein